MLPQFQVYRIVMQLLNAFCYAHFKCSYPITIQPYDNTTDFIFSPKTISVNTYMYISS